MLLRDDVFIGGYGDALQPTPGSMDGALFATNGFLSLDAEFGTPTYSPTANGAASANVDWNWISTGEGNRRTDGYLPVTSGDPNYNRVGITTATGVDLYQVNLDTLDLSASTRTALEASGAIGISGDAAKAWLDTHGGDDILTQAQAIELDRAVVSVELPQLISDYEKITGKEFQALKSDAQTLLFDMRTEVVKQDETAVI